VSARILASARTLTVAGAVVAFVALGAPAAGADAAGAAVPPAKTTTPIEHFIFLMQGDRTFDNYFGTYPGADGIPAGTCQNLVAGRPRSGCVAPFPLHGKQTAALTPGRSVIANQYDKGKMDGFVAAYGRQGRDGTSAMGYYDERDLPYYWAVARQYLLFDRFFATAPYGIRLNRSYWVSAAPPPGNSERVPATGFGDAQQTIFDRLQTAGVSWKFYIEDYNPAETFKAMSATETAPQTARVPLLTYARFVNDPALAGHLADLSEYYNDLAAGTLPAVAYVSSSVGNERSARSVDAGQLLVRNMVTELMRSRYWSTSAFMWSYDGSGGWFDHVPPPTVDGQPLGLRVPALLVSPYAPTGQVVHTPMDYTSALAFIEQNWDLAPLTKRDAAATSIASALDFSSPPRPAVIIPMRPHVPAVYSVRTGPVLWLYTAALVVGVAFVLTAGVWSARQRRRKAVIASARSPEAAEVAA
jgi:phospholipase C